MTETAGGVVSHVSGQVCKPGSVGTPGAGRRAAHRRAPAARSCAAGEPGEVQLRAPGHDARLLAQPRGDAGGVRRDGWFRTGDVGYLDADGYLFLVDRTKDVIMRGGYSVYPREVEDALYEHPAVSEAAVVGVPDELLGEEVVALVVPRAGQRVRSGGDQGVHARARRRLQVPAPRRRRGRAAAQAERQDPQARDRPRRRCARRSTPAARPQAVVSAHPVRTYREEGDRHAGRRGPCRDRRRQPRRPLDGGVPRRPGRPVARRRAPSGHRDPPARGARQPAHVELYRALGLQGEIEAAAAAEFVQNGAIMSVESLGGKELEWYFRIDQRGRREPQPGAAAVRHADRARADPAQARRGGSAPGSSTATEAVSLEQDDDGVTVPLRDRDGGARAHACARATSSRPTAAKSPMRERLGIAHARARHVLRQHHDLLPRRRQAAARRSQPERDLRLRPAPAGFFRFSLAGDAGFLVVNPTVDDDGRAQHDALGEDTSEERCIEYVRARARRPGHRGRDRERAALERDGRLGGAAAGGARVPRRRRGAQHAARPAASAATPACRTATTWPGSSRSCCAARPGPELLDDATTPSAGRSPSSRSSRPTRATCCGSIPALGKENLHADRRPRRRSSSATATTPAPWCPEPGEDGSLWENPHEPTARPGSRAPHLALARRRLAPRRSTSCAAGSSCWPGPTARPGATPRRQPGAGARPAGREPLHDRRAGLRGALRHGSGGRGAAAPGRLHRLACAARRPRDANADLRGVLRRILDRA